MTCAHIRSPQLLPVIPPRSGVPPLWTTYAPPGYGVAFEPDLDAMIPLERWRFESLDAS